MNYKVLFQEIDRLEMEKLFKQSQTTVEKTKAISTIKK